MTARCRRKRCFPHIKVVASWWSCRSRSCAVQNLHKIRCFHFNQDSSANKDANEDHKYQGQGPSWGWAFSRLTGPDDSPGPGRCPCSSCWCRQLTYAIPFDFGEAKAAIANSEDLILFNPFYHYLRWNPRCCPCGANRVLKSHTQPLRREKHPMWRNWGRQLLLKAALVEEEVTVLVYKGRMRGHSKGRLPAGPPRWTGALTLL